MTRWYQEKKSEHFYKEAKKVGYRARSAFKLKQIQKKYHIIKKGDTVLDLGAAPGGWTQITQEILENTGRIIAVDIQPIKPINNIQIIQGDITEPSTLDQIKQTMNQQKADVILSDMSPDITGNYTLDQARSIHLCETTLQIAKTMLKPQGNLILKAFEGEDTKQFIDKIKHSFYIVKQFSPKASRKTSSETYIIAKSYKI